MGPQFSFQEFSSRIGAWSEKLLVPLELILRIFIKKKNPQSQRDTDLLRSSFQLVSFLCHIFPFKQGPTVLVVRGDEKRSASSCADIPKGHLVVYIGVNQKKRFVIPISYLNHPSFQELLYQAEEEFGFHHIMGGLTIPCSQDLFTDLISGVSRK
ncbi:hypothetical protein ACS0TY_003904 [Phlomoides rotata]